MKVYCLPHAGGSISIFEPIKKLQNPNLLILPIEYPGHGVRLYEPLISTMEQLVEHVADIVQNAQGSYCLFGHSMGAILAYLVSLRCTTKPTMVFVSGSGIPEKVDANNKIGHLERELFMEKIQAYNGLPQEVLRCDEMIDIAYPILKNDFTILEQYLYPDLPKIDIPIIGINGKDDDHVEYEAFEGWQAFT